MSLSDLETHALVARLTLEDLEASYGRRWGKLREGHTPSDEEFALRLQAEQLRQWISIAEDARMAISLDTACENDASWLDAHAIAEQAAIEDRRAALALSRGQSLPPPTANQRRLEDPSFNLHPETAGNHRKWGEKNSEAELEGDGGGGDDDSSSITVTANNQMAIGRDAMIQRSFRTPSMAGPSLNQVKPANCVVCYDRVRVSGRQTLHAPCDHFYCKNCAVDLVRAFTCDESLYPLRCCQTAIPRSSILPLIIDSVTLLRTFEVKNAEWGVTAKNRIYCCSPTCSSFLGSSVGRERLVGIPCTSLTCRASTCPRCKQAAHPNDLDCSANRATEEVRALAREQGWQTCPGCQTIVELNVGCYHMTCRCRVQFCYLCAEPWKRCSCPQWDENRLVATAEQRLENQIGARAMQMRQDAPRQYEQRVRRVAANLRTNHNCAAHTWRYRQGGGRCEECHFILPTYLLICTGCSLLACVRCSRNRL